MRYRLAGAYDSNVALAAHRPATTARESYERMAEILRRTELRGDDLADQPASSTTGSSTGSSATA